MTTGVRKFRAANTREALEQIKRELGEDAYVLDTREVTNGGFLGFGKSRQIEVSATPNETTGHSNGISFTEDSPALPGAAIDFDINETTAPLANLLSILPSSPPNASAKAKRGLGSPLPRQERVVDAVELNDSEPKIIHAANAASQSVFQVDTEETSGETAQPPASVGKELEKLRAEMKELKHSVGSLAKRRAKAERPEAMSLKNLGELLETPFYEHFLTLSESGFSSERTRQMLTDILPWYKEGAIEADAIAQAAILQYLERKISFTTTERQETLITALIGPTGVGKTTTIAKLAARKALHENRRVELVTLDTYRIAAVEQLKTYAEIIGANCTVVRSVFELDAVLRKLPPDVTVFIDTTGRSPHDLADQHEVSDYLSTRSDIGKCLVLPASCQPADAANTIERFGVYGADCVAVTKVDETLRPAAIIDVLFDHDLPLSYLCTGQRVPEDIVEASAEFITDQILGTAN